MEQPKGGDSDGGCSKSTLGGTVRSSTGPLLYLPYASYTMYAMSPTSPRNVQSFKGSRLRT
eukprot:4249477-Pyramimonas_sp.AAC.1